MDLHYQKSVSQELIWVLSYNFQRMLKENYRLTKRQYEQGTTNHTITATFTSTTTAITTSYATTCKAKSIDMIILISI